MRLAVTGCFCYRTDGTCVAGSAFGFGRAIRSTSPPERSAPMSRIRRILHPSDFSRASGAAFAKAVELAKANRAELLLVHVRSPVVLMAGGGYVSPKVYEDLDA